MSDQNTFALKIRDLLHERNMTQKTLSDLTNIPKSTLNRILGDDSDPSFEQIAAISKALAVSLDVIAGTAAPGAESASTEQIADTAINAYTELIKERDKNIEYLNARLADKEALVAAKDEIIALQRSIIESMRSGLNGKCQD
jgi:transcriptional regulator with XRE-family HTH domain